MKKLTLLSIAWTGLLLGSCQENDLGSGANTIAREYAKPAPEAWGAAQKSAEAADFKVTSDKHDRFGGQRMKDEFERTTPSEGSGR
ncbi:MAG TPA: hypothetical protein VJB14_11000 [Planctomycetota bacterium]|nr:hypothetical protein [Planctomycetota bacterium]